MLRFAIVLIVAGLTGGIAEAADQTLVHPRVHRAAIGLPAGLPRPHYHFRTTITYAEPYTYRRPWPRYSVYGPPALYAPVVYVDPFYGSHRRRRRIFTYWYRLPYACGVYGYC